MIDREPLKRAQKAWRKRQNEAAGGLAGWFGPVRALGGLPYAANGRMISVREPANGESRIIGLLHDLAWFWARVLIFVVVSSLSARDHACQRR